MIFLNAILLFGAAAFSIPLIIHLLNRSKFQTVDWGAMLFLEDASKVNSRRLQWQTWLLLLLRCLIPIVLAICMARPMVKNFLLSSGLSGSGGEQTTAVLVVDSSISMQAGMMGPDGKSPSTLSKEASRQANDLVAKSRGNTRWTVSAWEDSRTGVQQGASRDTTVIKDRLSQIDSRAGFFSLLSQIDAAVNILVKSPEPSQRVIVLSDFQANDMQSLESHSLAALREKIDRLPIKPKIVLLPIGNRQSASEPIVTPENVSIVIDGNTQALVGVKQPWELRARVKNHSPVAVSNLPILIQVDGVSLTTRRVDLPGEAETQLVVAFEFSSIGPHVVTASIEHSEPVVGDNQASWSVLAVGSIPTLIVSDDFSRESPSQRNGDNEHRAWADADFLTAALGSSPFSKDLPAKDGALFLVSRIASNECTVSDLKRHRLVLLSNSSRLSKECSDDLGKWVGQGGTLMVLPGEHSAIDWYNGLMEAQDSKGAPNDAPGDVAKSVPSMQRPLFPYAFEAKPEVLEDGLTGLSIRREPHTHPSVRFLNDSRWGAIDNLDVRKWLRMVPHDQVTKQSRRLTIPTRLRFVSLDSNSTDSKSTADNKPDMAISSTILSLSSGDPFLAIKQIGLGSVIQCATSAGDQWSNWPMRPIYLPMIQQLLLGSIPPGRWVSNVQTGEMLTLPTEEMLRWIESKWSDDPSKIPANISSTRLMKWSFPGEESKSSTDQVTDLDRVEGETGLPAIIARQPGVYTARLQTNTGGDKTKEALSNATNAMVVSMCAQLPQSESDLRLESTQSLNAIAKQIDASVLADVNEYIALESGESSELWRWFLIVLLGLLFGEVLLQRYLSVGGAR